MAELTAGRSQANLDLNIDVRFVLHVIQFHKPRELSSVHSLTSEIRGEEDRTLAR